MSIVRQLFRGRKKSHFADVFSLSAICVVISGSGLLQQQLFLRATATSSARDPRVLAAAVSVFVGVALIHLEVRGTSQPLLARLVPLLQQGAP